MDEETKNALVTIAEFVGKSGNPAAGLLLNEFNQELIKPTDNGGKIHQLWEGLVAVLPDITTLTDAVTKVTCLFEDL